MLYNLARRGPEFDLLPLLQKLSMPCMAYSPVEQGRLLGHPGLDAVAARHAATATQVALAWLLRRLDTLVIPKAGTVDHVMENRAAVDLVLSDHDLQALDAAFPPPARKQTLAML